MIAFVQPPGSHPGRVMFSVRFLDDVTGGNVPSWQRDGDLLRYTGRDGHQVWRLASKPDGSWVWGAWPD